MATITRLSGVPWARCSCDIFIGGKKLRGDQEDTQDDPNERRINVYSFNTDKYSYASAGKDLIKHPLMRHSPLCPPGK